MAATAQLIDTSEEDSLLAVTKYIGELADGDAQEAGTSGFAAECEALCEGGQYGQLLDKLVASLDTVTSKCSSEQDLECCLDITCNLVLRIPPAGVAAAAGGLARALAATPDSRPEARLQALVNLYNFAYDAPSKLTVLLQALQFAKAAGLADIMLPVIRAQAEGWASALSLAPPQDRQLLTACADCLAGCTRKPKTAAKEVYRLLARCLASYEGTSGAELAEAADVAARLAAEFVRAPDLFQFDQLTSPAVAQLASHPQHAPLHRLLTILVTGSVQDYQAHVAANGALLQQLEVAPEEALSKMRLMALMGLAHGTTEITFQQIQEALQLEAGELEAAVVGAIGRRVLEGRIDQLRGVVAVSRCAPRTFGPEQWAELQRTLRGWSDSVAAVRAVAAEDDGSVLPKGLALNAGGAAAAASVRA